MICDKCGKKVEPIRTEINGLGAWMIECCEKRVEHPLLDRVVWLWLKTDGAKRKDG